MHVCRCETYLTEALALLNIVCYGPTAEHSQMVLLQQHQLLSVQSDPEQNTSEAKGIAQINQPKEIP